MTRPVVAIRDIALRLPERFVARLDRQANGCLVWTGPKNAKGYGIFYIDNRQPVAHRFAYEALIGPVPAGLELDHLCRNRPCVEVTHLEPITHAENMARGAHALKTECPKGHPYNERNTYRRPNDGGRDCRACMSARTMAWQARKRAA